MEGTLPSGYPPHIERLLPRLLNDYDLPEREAREQLPAYAAHPRPNLASTPDDDGRGLPPPASDGSFDRAGQYDASTLHRCMSLLPDLSSASPAEVWPVPTGFLHGVLGADPKRTVVIVATRAGAGHFQPGDRLFVDMSSRTPSADIYVAVECARPRFVFLDGSNPHERSVLDALPSEGRFALLGRVVGQLGRPQHHKR